MSIIPLSLYVHFPWCLNKCPYCDFNSSNLPNREIIPGYVDRLLFDMEMEIINNLNLRIHTGRHSRMSLAGIQKKPELKSIYFGGGTPSLLSPEEVRKIIGFVKGYFDFAEDIEISLEANSKTVDLDLSKGFKEAGINRLSVGVQSFNDTQLKKIQRVHDAKQALEAVKTVKLAGFDNFNIDLMFGLPNQEIKDTVLDLETALNFSPNHLS